MCERVEDRGSRGLLVYLFGAVSNCTKTARTASFLRVHTILVQFETAPKRTYGVIFSSTYCVSNVTNGTGQ
jgi:vancomycin permeability regulator SanA